MPESYLAWGLGLLITTGIGILLSQNRRQTDGQKETNDKLNVLGNGVTEVRTVLLGVDGTPGLVSRVNSLHEWRNELQRRELEEANDELRQLRRRTGDLR